MKPKSHPLPLKLSVIVLLETLILVLLARSTVAMSNSPYFSPPLAYGILLGSGIAVSIFSILVSLGAQKLAQTLGPPIAPAHVFAKANKPTEDMIPVFIVNHTMAAHLFAFLVFYLVHVRPIDFAQELSLVGISQSVVGSAVLLLAYDLQSWCFHYSGHHVRFLWKHVHSLHHEIPLPNSPLAGIYGDALESFIVACFAFWMPVVFASYISFGGLFLFAMMISFLVQLNHSGHRIDIPWIFSTRFHLAHHVKYNVNFAEHTALWDWLFGTLYMPQTYEELLTQWI